VDQHRVALSRGILLAALAVVPLAVLAVFFVLPVTGMVGRGLRPEGHWDLGGLPGVLGLGYIQRALWFTLWSAAAGAAISVVLGLPAAYALHRLAFPLQRLVRAALLVPFVLPTVVVGVAFRQLMLGPLRFLHADQSAGAILAGLVFFNVAVVIRSVGAAWEGLDRRPAEAAAALGASPTRVFLTVTLPALRPAIVSAATVVFLFCATAYGVVLILGGLHHSNVETQIWYLTMNQFDLTGAAALALVQMATIVVLLALAARLRATPDPTAQRVPARPRRPRLADVPQLAATALLLALVALPIVSLLVGSLRVHGTWSLANYRALQTPGTHHALPTTATAALAMSLRTAVGAAALAMTLGVLVAVVVTRRAQSRLERRVRGVLDGVFMLPLGVSAVMLGLGFLITLNHPPVDFRDEPWLVDVAQALVALPLVVRILVPVLGGIDDRQRQAAASLGASPLRAFATVDLAVMWRPLLAAAGFALAVSLGEFGATSFVVPFDHPTLPVVISRLLDRPGDLNYGMALAASCVLAAATAVVMLLVERLRVPSLGAL